MAELLLKVGSGSGYEDGDILVAVNNIDILRCHAEHIASPKKPNELYLRTFQLPAHWNAHSADTTPLTSHPRIHHAAGDCATKLRRMREWLAG